MYSESIDRDSYRARPTISVFGDTKMKRNLNIIKRQREKNSNMQKITKKIHTQSSHILEKHKDKKNK